MRVLIIDLNNFAMYPSIAIGYIAAALREDDIDTHVLSPLSIGSEGVTRERRPPVWGAISQRARYQSAISRNDHVVRARAALARRQLPELARRGDRLVASVQERMDASQFDVVLVSTYLMYHEVSSAIGRLCAERDIPLVIGGPYFSQPEVAREWIDIPGLSALVGAEIEPHIAELTRRLHDGRSIDDIPGVWRTDGETLTIDGPPLTDLDALPFPDYTDFPWERYRTPIVPMITGRGCGWGRCTFCSDITSTAGRTFRSRSPGNVLEELRYQSERHDTRNFVFTDLKLNSSLEMWEALLTRFPEVVPGAEWVASIHAGAGAEDGLSSRELEAARNAGLRRLTTGLESGSQRVLNLMKKGTRLAETERVIRAAHAAGIGVRVTMIIGYPGEEERDVRETTRFLANLDGCIERIVLNRFQIMTGAAFHRSLESSPTAHPSVTQVTVNHRLAHVDHHYDQTENAPYRRAVYDLIKCVHRVNRRPLAQRGRVFEGVM